MDFVSKARIRLEHWIGHNEHHLEDYQQFADELEANGQEQSAGSIREMIDLTRQSTDSLRRALSRLGE
jgi:hypothetical protein